MPCAITAAVIHFSRYNGLVNGLLSLKPIVFLGKISYSLYLWHWCVLSYVRYIYQDYYLPSSYIVFAVIIIFLLSLFSFYIIEQPARKSELSFKKSFIYFYILPSLFIVASNRYISHKIKKVEQNNRELLFLKDVCHDNMTENCKKGDLSKKANVLVVGDSHTGHLNPFIDVIGKKEGWSADVLSVSFCTFLFDVDPVTRQDLRGLDSQCPEYNDKINDIYKNYDVIIFSERWEIPMKDVRNFPELFENTLKRLVSENKKVYVINSTNVFQYNIKERFYFYKKHPFLSGFMKNYSEEDKVPVSEFYLKKLTELEDVISKVHGVEFINLANYLPDNLIIDEKPLLIDQNHLNSFGAKYLAQQFIKDGKFFVGYGASEKNG